MSAKALPVIQQRVFAGVCGGLAEYFNLDSNNPLIWVVTVFLGNRTADVHHCHVIIPKGENYGGTVVTDEDGNTYAGCRNQSEEQFCAVYRRHPGSNRRLILLISTILSASSSESSSEPSEVIYGLFC